MRTDMWLSMRERLHAYVRVSFDDEGGSGAVELDVENAVAFVIELVGSGYVGSQTHFLKRLPKVATEMALHVLAYNLTRVMNIMGIQPLMAAIRA